MNSAISVGYALPPFVGDGLILTTRELSPISIDRLDERPQSSADTAVQLCHCKVSGVDIA